MTYFWAKTTVDEKPGLSVYSHMVNVGDVARSIAEIFPELLRRFSLKSSVVGALAALHDLGKISPGFQRKCELWLEENGLTKIARNGVWDTSMESDHGKVSHSAIQKFLLQTGIHRESAKYVSAVLGAHHGRLNPPNDRGYLPRRLISDSASQIDWDAERMSNARKIWDLFEGDRVLFKLTDDSPALWWLAGLTSVADWIGSDERFFPPDSKDAVADAVARTQDALGTIGLMPPALKGDLTFQELFGFPPNEIQIKALDAITEPGVYVIEAPMGMGKTEAALGAAYQLMISGKAKGIFFALPTQATSNRMHLRMNEFLKRITPDAPMSRLIHGNSWLTATDCGILPAATFRKGSAQEDARTGRDWFSSTKRALIAPFGVGTIDQALLGVVAAKHFFVRHFALAGKVVILDEVHSYDLYTGTLIDTLITTLEGLGCTVIVLSATLTGKRRGQLVSQSGSELNDLNLPYPLISGRREDMYIESIAAEPPVPRTVKVDFVNAEKATEEATALACEGGAVLWICNTIDAAQKQYQRFKEQTQGKFPLGLLHSRFPYWQRELLENEWMERFGKSGETRCGSILVSTQVVEQSVDLDADLMITELAPNDMLLQRLGRLWRHERENRPVNVARICIIEENMSLEEFRTMSPKEIKQELGSKGLVYDPFVLLRSLEVWHGRKEVSIPSQIRSLIEATYETRDDEPESWSKLYEEVSGKAYAYREKARMSSNIWNIPLPDEEGVQTRLNEVSTVSVVLCRSITEVEAVFVDGTSGRLGGDTFQLKTAQAIHKNIVRVPHYCFDSVNQCLAFNDYLFGMQSVGIVADGGAVEIKGLKSGVRFSYSDELGLVIQKRKGEV